MTTCGRYECDGRHYCVATYRDPGTDELQMQRDLLDDADEREHLENVDAPNGWVARVEAKRCPDCNPVPDPVAAVEDAAQTDDDEATRERLWYQDK